MFNVGAFLMTTGGCQNSFLYDEACFPVCSTLVAPQRPPAGSQEKAGVPGKEYFLAEGGWRGQVVFIPIHRHALAHKYTCVYDWLVISVCLYRRAHLLSLLTHTHTHKLIKEKQEFRAFYVVGFRV